MKVESNQKWMIFSKLWSDYNETQDLDETNTIEMNHVFANHSEEEEIFPLMVKEIVAAQKADPILKHCFNSLTAMCAHVRPLFDKLLW